MKLLFALNIILCLKFLMSRKCGTDFLKAKKAFNTVKEEEQRSLSSQEFEPIRIHFDYSLIDKDANALDFADIRDKIMPKTKEILESLLKVKRIPNKLKFSERYCDNFLIPSYLTTTGEGVSADLVLFVMIDNTGFFLENGIEAAAINCIQHGVTKRPVAGFIQFKPELKVTNSTALDYMTWLSFHEITHVLVMNDSLYGDFMKPDGTSYTKAEVVGRKQLETNSSNNQETSFLELKLKSKKKGNLKMTLKGEEDITQLTSKESSLVENNDPLKTKKSEIPKYKINYHIPPMRVNKESVKYMNYIKTPKILETARKHFGWNELFGVPLEYNGGQGTAGAHWSKKYMNTDYMIGDSYGENLVSDMTLALFEDSGWYKVNENMANLFVWGKNEGIDFFTKDCINRNSTAPNGFSSNFPNEFCDAKNQPVCSTSFIFRGVCSIKSFRSELPLYQRHFSDPRLGGVDELTDRCPIPIEQKYDQPYYGGSCRVGKKKFNFEKICPDCACFSTTLLEEGAGTADNHKAACFEFKCNPNGKIQVSVDGNFYECDDNNEILSVAGHNGKITCPDKKIICSSNYKCKFGCTDQYSASTPFIEYSS